VRDDRVIEVLQQRGSAKLLRRGNQRDQGMLGRLPGAGLDQAGGVVPAKVPAKR
jgi:hypothetical protein